MKDVEHIVIKNCSICGNSTESLGKPAKYYVKQIGKTMEYFYQFCKDCDFVYCRNPLGEEALEKYYTTRAVYYERKRRKPDIRHTEGQVAFALKFSPPAEELAALEIGPATDAFLATLVAQRRKARVFFSELNEMGRVQLLRQGYEEIDWQAAQQFHLIAMNHVLEHIPYPATYLRMLRRRSRPDGIIYIEVPDQNPQHRYVQGLVFSHVNYFTIQSMIRLAERCGLVIVAIESTRTPDSSTAAGGQVLRVAYKKAPRQSDTLFTVLKKSLSVTDFIVRSLEKRKGERTAFYGAAEQTYDILPYLEQEIRPLKIVDDDENKIGQTIFGIEVVGSNELKVEDYDTILVTILNPHDAVIKLLHKKGFKDSQIVRVIDLIQDALK